MIVAGTSEAAATLRTLVVQLAMAFLAHRVALAALYDAAIEHDKAYWTEHRVAKGVGLKDNEFHNFAIEVPRATCSANAILTGDGGDGGDDIFQRQMEHLCKVSKIFGDDWRLTKFSTN